jgi:hypothetical protein
VYYRLSSDRPSEREHVLTALRELIEALDRRVPHVERLGEFGIAHDAAALRQEAALRLEELESTGRERCEDTRAVARMTDDGAPVREP